jgi:hypothetical protein
MIPKTEQYEMRPPWSKILLKIVLIIVILLVSLSITASAVNLTIYAAYKRYVDNFSQVTRLDPHLANLVFVLFLVPAFFGVRSYLFSFRKERRRTGLAVLVGLAVLYNGSLYLITRNQYFVGPDTKYYALVPGGVVFSTRPGIEPQYGIPFQPVTPDKIRWLLRIKQGQIQAVPDPARHDWFDRVTRDPVLWYYTDADGAFHFFDGPGYAPATGDELKAVTPAIRRQWEKEIRDRADAAGANAVGQQTAGHPDAGNSPENQQVVPQVSLGAAPLPAIASFEVVPFPAGGSGVAILRWTVTNATAVSIEPGVGAVNPSSGYKLVRPVKTTKYTLQARGEAGASVIREVTFTVPSAGKPPCGPK